MRAQAELSNDDPLAAEVRATRTRADALTTRRQDPPAPAPIIQEPQPSAAPQGEPAPASDAPPQPSAATLPAWEPRYHALDAVAALCERWVAEAPARGLAAERIVLGATHAGARAVAVRLGRAEGAPLAQRPTLVLLGGLDGVSLTGCEAVLASLAAIVEHPAELPPNVAVLAIPWAAPDALAQQLAGAGSAADGRDRRPLDDDGDGLVDEDGPDDLDGDGQVLEMLVEDPQGPWARSQDPRFLVPARPGDAPRYRWSREGRDDDGDGELNEDPPGGVALASAFPAGFTPQGSLATGLSLPLEDEHARSLCTLLAESRALGVVCFQGDHGGVALPGCAWEDAGERELGDHVARLFARAVGRAGDDCARSLAELGRDPQRGSALAWMRARLSSFVLEVSPWGPQVERNGAEIGPSPANARLDARGDVQGASPSPGTPAARGGAAAAALDRAWARWVDDGHGGFGFMEWHPVDSGSAGSVLVGGWLPFTRRNAPEKSLPAALNGVSAFVLRLLGELPRPELAIVESRREGELCFLRARLVNRGTLACNARPDAGAPLRVQLALPQGARLLAGAETFDVERLRGGESSREFSCTVIAPAQSAFVWTVALPWGGTLRQEVRP